MPNWTGTARPYGEWPEWLQRWWRRAQHEGGGFCDNAGAFADWRPETIRTAREAVGQFISGLDPDRDGAFICPETIRAYLSYMTDRGLAIRTIYTRIVYLYRVAKRVWPPEDQWHWLATISARLGARARKAPKPRRPFVHMDDLFSTGIELMDDANARDLSLYAALQFRDGLLLSLLATAPVRLKNAANATDRNINTEHCTLNWQEHETKNHHPLSYHIGSDLTMRLQIWIDIYRPWILDRFGKQTDALWLNRHGDPLSAKGLRTRLKVRTQAALGVAVRPHDIRSCVATSILMEFPERIQEARELLGHVNPKSIESYKGPNAAFGAQRKTSAIRAEIRKNARPRARPRLRLQAT